MTERGRHLESDWAEYVFATVHPSFILRIRDPAEREAALAALVEDLKLINRVLGDPA